LTCPWMTDATSLHPGNVEPWELWLACKTQWRAAGFGLIGLDLPAVKVVAHTLGIQWSASLLQKIQALERYELRQMKKDRGNDRASSNPAGRRGHGAAD
jgi:hypothetical protein